MKTSHVTIYTREKCLALEHFGFLLMSDRSTLGCFVYEKYFNHVREVQEFDWIGMMRNDNIYCVNIYKP